MQIHHVIHKNIEQSYYIICCFMKGSHNHGRCLFALFGGGLLDVAVVHLVMLSFADGKVLSIFHQSVDPNFIVSIGALFQFLSAISGVR